MQGLWGWEKEGGREFQSFWLRNQGGLQYYSQHEKCYKRSIFGLLEKVGEN